MSSAECCSGTLHEGTPVGGVKTLHGLPCYISDPPNGAQTKAIIVIVPDAFGWELTNSRILADAYAKRIGDVSVYMPEFMDGKHLDPIANLSIDQMTDKHRGITSKILPTWRAISTMGPFLVQNRLSITRPRIFAFFTALRQSTSVPIGVAGFCWGGKPVCLLAAEHAKTPDGRSLVDCAFMAHPSNLDVPSDLERYVRPTSICQGSEDFVLNMDGVKKMRPVFEKKNSVRDSADFELEVVEGAKHGFAVRGDPNKEQEAKQCQIAEDQAVAWFQRYLVGQQ